MITNPSGVVKAQVVSHELRKLASASNQFGIDALRALDRIEPHDKVIVFSPVCLGASLSMVMMGSSKRQAVSSLRHALYVWSMRPQEINRAYRDVLDHIGVNQSPSSSSTAGKLPKLENLTIAEAQEERGWWQNDPRSSGGGNPMTMMSLPRLVRLRETSDRQPHASWWTTSSASGRSKLMESRAEFPPEFSQMSALSSIYVQRGLHMNYNYNLLLRDFYRTVVHPVDFARNSEETRQHINSLVAASTEGKVKDLMKRHSFDGAKQVPRALIVSTFHFRGTLDLQMKTATKPTNNSTRERRSNKQQQYIQTEPTLLKYGQFKRGLDCACLEIPFSNRLISLVVLMPKHANATDLLLTKLSATVLSDMLASLTVRQVSLEIPVIKFGRGPTNVLGLLQELSLNDTFLGGLGPITSTETGLNRWLRAEDIVHETSIDIGTAVRQTPQEPQQLAPAAQAEDRLKVGAHNESSKRRREQQRSPEPEMLRLDRPFFYFIVDAINGLVLTMGRIRQ